MSRNVAKCTSYICKRVLKIHVILYSRLGILILCFSNIFVQINDCYWLEKIKIKLISK